MTKFSVIIPLYNKEKDISETLASVLKQTHTNFEVIIVDDGSTDDSVAVINRIKDSRISLFQIKNNGVSFARNLGVEKATTSFIVFLDADDYWYPNHLEIINSLIKKFPEANWLATAYEKRRTSNLRTAMNSPIMYKGENWSGLVDDYFKNSFVDSLVWTSAVCFKKSFFQLLKGFNLKFTHGEDTDLWIRAALQEKIVFSNTITAVHNLIGQNRSAYVQLKNRFHFNTNVFIEEESANPHLKKYLDLNRYSLAIQFKKENNKKKFKEYAEAIDINNLNKKQQFLLRADRNVLKFLNVFQNIAEKLGIRLSSF